MAYRGLQAVVPAFLEEYITSINYLPQELKHIFVKIKELDVAGQAILDEVELAVNTALNLARSKANQLKQKSSYDNIQKTLGVELERSQKKSVELSTAKIELAERAYELCDSAIRSLDESLSRFESHLKKEGKWPIYADTEKDLPNANAPGNTPRRRSHPPAQSTQQRLMNDNTSWAENETLGGTGFLDDAQNATKKEADRLSGEAPGGSLSNGARNGMANSNRQTIQGRRKRDATGANSILSKAEQSEISQPEDKKRKRNEPAQNTENSIVQNFAFRENVIADPNEPRYCFCNEVSYGDMVACEEDCCPYEWFHFKCVGLTQTPKGSWRCPSCLSLNNKTK